MCPKCGGAIDYNVDSIDIRHIPHLSCYARCKNCNQGMRIYFDIGDIELDDD